MPLAAAGNNSIGSGSYCAANRPQHGRNSNASPQPWFLPSSPTPTAATLLTGSLPACGQILPILSAYDGPLLETLDPDPQALARLQELIPCHG